MKKITLILLILLLTVGAGCSEKEAGISEDATITHKTYGGFINQEIEVQELTVNRTTVIFTTSDRNGNFLKTYEKPLNESSFDDLIDLFEKNGFLEMEKSYIRQEGQPIVADAGVLEISLIQKDLTKKVTVDPYYSEYMPEGLQEIDAALVDLREYALSTYPGDTEGETEEETEGETEGETERETEGEAQNGEAGEEPLVELKYREPENESTPWDQWYAEGNIQFIKAPTQAELIIAYYGSLYHIEVIDVKRLEACDLYYTCGGYFYVAKVREKDAGKMKELGWTDMGEF
ncbi:hypothetical protein [Methanosarcina sp. KYL-1]|uniref:hypothetical protein n=1 Tax=Methanosarcina sp. KYL-1 TaxID=2602068 RepID=UPI002101B50F|nr:hypothetical protein [Methanosarcina sp. KYL-1]